MKIYRHKETQQYHARLSDGAMSKGFSTKEELMALLKKLQRSERREQRYTANDARRDCGLRRTPYGWE